MSEAGYIKSETLADIGRWAVDTFGDASPARVAAKANEEMAEMICDLSAGHMISADTEAADVIIVLCHYAAIRGIDLQKLINEKMAVNRKREWKIRDGVGQHV